MPVYAEEKAKLGRWADDDNFKPASHYEHAILCKPLSGCRGVTGELLVVGPVVSSSPLGGAQL